MGNVRVTNFDVPGSVFLIDPKPCTAATICPKVKLNDLNDMDPRVKVATGEKDIKLLDGDDPLLGLLKDSVKSGAGTALKFAARTDDGAAADNRSDQALALVLSETARLRRQLRRLQGRQLDTAVTLPENGALLPG